MEIAEGLVQHDISCGRQSTTVLVLKTFIQLILPATPVYGRNLQTEHSRTRS